MRKTLLLALCVCIAWAGWASLAVLRRDLGADVAQVLTARLRRPVQVGQARVHPLGELHLRDLNTLSELGGLSAREVTLYVPLAEALQGRLRLREASARGVQLRSGRSAAGGLVPAGATLRIGAVSAVRGADQRWRLVGRQINGSGSGALLWPLRADQLALEVSGGRLQRLALSGLWAGGLGPVALLLRREAAGLWLRGELSGAALRVLYGAGLDAELRLPLLSLPLSLPLGGGLIDLNSAQLDGHWQLHARPAPGTGRWTEGQLSTEGRLAVEGLTLSHPLLSAQPLKEVRFTLEGGLEVDQAAGLRLRSPGVSLRVGDLQLSAAGSLDADLDGYRFDLRLSVEDIECATALRSLPRALVPRLDGLGVSGRLGGALSLRVDSQRLPEVDLKNDVALRCQVLRDPPLADAHQLFDRRLSVERTGPDGQPQRVPLGPEALDAAVDAAQVAGPGGEADGGEAADAPPPFVPYERLPWPLVRAFLVAEDNLFFQHQGFDAAMIIRALGIDLQDQQVARGASTISQQVAKNLWLGPERSLSRKLEEAILTWRLEQVVQKERILEVYLNLVELGSGIYGLPMAARHYFRARPEELSAEQAAQLAALLPAPRRGMDGAWGRRYRELLPRVGRAFVPTRPR